MEEYRRLCRRKENIKVELREIGIDVNELDGVSLLD